MVEKICKAQQMWLPVLHSKLTCALRVTAHNNKHI